ncbi:MAG: FlgD immunoglobulin-like domain containing protein [Hyphomicrobiales bacterium]
MRPRDPGPFDSRPARAAIFAIAVFLTALALPPAARATVTSVTVEPPAPLSCDSTTAIVAGTLVSDCERVREIHLSGPTTVDVGGVLVQRFDATVVVEEPNNQIVVMCFENHPPYSARFPLGLLPPGPYAVRATEYRVPFGTNTPDDSSTVSLRFSVAPGDSCPTPPEVCALLDFVPADGILPPNPGGGVVACDALARPGGTGCFAIELKNPVPVWGVQVEFMVSDPTAGPLPAGTFTPVSVEKTPRTSDFTVSWQASGPKVKALLYSATGSAIPPGAGPILRVCYATSPDTREMAFPMNFGAALVADTTRTMIPLCPTFAVITGWFCVGAPGGCDLNGDGRADVRDIVRLVRCALAGAGSDACPDTIAARADCNQDGAIDVRDVICCVRKILATGLLPPPPDSTGAAPVRVGFTGPATWITPVSGRAVLGISPAGDLAAAQFAITPDDGIRIRGMSVLSGGGDGASVEWQTAPDGSVRAFLYRLDAGAATSGATAGAGAASAPIQVAIDFEPSGNLPIVSRRLVLDAFDGATWDAAALPTDAVEPTVTVPGTSLAAPAVYPARPNPFASETEVSYALPRAARVSLRLYDVSGRLVRTLVAGARSEGVHHVRWDGRNDAGGTAVSGIYFVKLSADGIVRTDRLLKLR